MWEGGVERIVSEAEESERAGAVTEAKEEIVWTRERAALLTAAALSKIKCWEMVGCVRGSAS